FKKKNLIINVLKSFSFCLGFLGLSGLNFFYYPPANPPPNTGPGQKRSFKTYASGYMKRAKSNNDMEYQALKGREA
ncbi:MAG: hypothetical protein ACTHK7_20365, partial [Aureliella sp.]